MKLEDIKTAVVVWGAVSGQGITYLKERGNLVVVPEVRPSLLGLYHNARVLAKEGIRFVCCCDNVLGLLFFKGKIDKTLLFCRKADRVAAVARAGSLYVVLLSRIHGVSVETMIEPEIKFTSQDIDATSLGGRKMVLESGDGIYADDEEVINEI